MLAGGGMLLISLDSLGIRLAEGSSWDIAFWLGVFTTLAMALLVPLRTRTTLPAAVRTDGWPVVASGLLQAASTTFFIIAINLTTVANVVVIVAASPVVAAVVARWAIKEKTGMRTWLAIAISVGGILVVVSGSLQAGRVGGDLFAVAAILSFATNLTLWRWHPRLNRMVAVGLGGLFMAMVALWPADPLAVDGRTLAILAFLGAIAGPAGRIAVASSTRYLPTSQVSLFTPVETVAATVWAWLFLSEPPPMATVFGGLVVLVAVAYGSVRPRQARPA